jgi:hypothetical protein
VFSPPSFKTPYDFAGLQGSSRRRARRCRRWTPEAVNALGGSDVVFASANTIAVHGGGLPDVVLAANFYFHATTAYDILRTNGVPLGKRDFMGRLK